MKTLIIIAMILVAQTCFAFDEWTTKDTALQTAYTVLHVIDWGQTANQAKRNWSYQINSPGYAANMTRDENNFILGKRPNESTVHLYFAGTLAAHTAISYMLPRGWREAWQGAGIGLEVWAVGANYNVGINGFF